MKQMANRRIGGRKLPPLPVESGICFVPTNLNMRQQPVVRVPTRLMTECFGITHAKLSEEATVLVRNLMVVMHADGQRQEETLEAEIIGRHVNEGGCACYVITKDNVDSNYSPLGRFKNWFLTRVGKQLDANVLHVYFSSKPPAVLHLSDNPDAAGAPQQAAAAADHTAAPAAAAAAGAATQQEQAEEPNLPAAKRRRLTQQGQNTSDSAAAATAADQEFESMDAMDALQQEAAAAGNAHAAGGPSSSQQQQQGRQEPAIEGATELSSRRSGLEERIDAAEAAPPAAAAAGAGAVASDPAATAAAVVARARGLSGSMKSFLLRSAYIAAGGFLVWRKNQRLTTAQAAPVVPRAFVFSELGITEAPASKVVELVLYIDGQRAEAPLKSMLKVSGTQAYITLPGQAKGSNPFRRMQNYCLVGIAAEDSSTVRMYFESPQMLAVKQQCFSLPPVDKATSALAGLYFAEAGVPLPPTPEEAAAAAAAAAQKEAAERAEREAAARAHHAATAAAAQDAAAAIANAAQAIASVASLKAKKRRPPAPERPQGGGRKRKGRRGPYKYQPGRPGRPVKDILADLAEQGLALALGLSTALSAPAPAAAAATASTAAVQQPAAAAAAGPISVPTAGDQPPQPPSAGQGQGQGQGQGHVYAALPGAANPVGAADGQPQQQRRSLVPVQLQQQQQQQHPAAAASGGGLSDAVQLGAGSESQQGANSMSVLASLNQGGSGGRLHFVPAKGGGLQLRRGSKFARLTPSLKVLKKQVLAAAKAAAAPPPPAPAAPAPVAPTTEGLPLAADTILARQKLEAAAAAAAVAAAAAAAAAPAAVAAADRRPASQSLLAAATATAAAAAADRLFASGTGRGGGRGRGRGRHARGRGPPKPKATYWDRPVGPRVSRPPSRPDVKLLRFEVLPGPSRPSRRGGRSGGVRAVATDSISSDSNDSGDSRDMGAAGRAMLGTLAHVLLKRELRAAVAPATSEDHDGLKGGVDGDVDDPSRSQSTTEVSSDVTSPEVDSDADSAGQGLMLLQQLLPTTSDLDEMQDAVLSATQLLRQQGPIDAAKKQQIQAAFDAAQDAEAASSEELQQQQVHNTIGMQLQVLYGWLQLWTKRGNCQQASAVLGQMAALAPSCHSVSSHAYDN